MQQDRRSQKKGLKWVPAVIVLAFALISAVGEGSSDIFFLIFPLLFLLIPVGIVVAIVLAIKKTKTANHTHDRIDHRTDLKINPETGKTQQSPVRNVPPHSPQEHWKQQLDGLLANGTIDRAEYKALLNRRF